jgi:hypothetical protein
MNPLQVMRWGLLGAVVFGSFMLGMKLKQAEWDKTENARLEEIQEQLRIEKERLDRANDILAEAQLLLASREQEARELNDRLQVEINRDPVTVTRTVQVPGECPAVVVDVPDAARYYQLFNCGISGDCRAGTPAEAGGGDVTVPGTITPAGLDGDGESP